MTAAWANQIIANKLAGLLCKDCGTLMGSAGRGVPRVCDACLDVAAEERWAKAQDEERAKLERETVCPICKKRLRSLAGRNQHMRMVHSAGDNERLLA